MTATDPAPLTLRIDVTSAVPVYEQLRTQVSALVSARRLVRGDRLPAARALAADLGIAVGTVARAYRELETGGWVTSRRRTGTVIAGPMQTNDPAPSGATASDQVERAADHLVRIGRATGLDDDALLTALRGALLR
ncbi:GntR family transcriptional regulator [Blastococcus saxobsidens]|uniref:Transcriptional regulator, GntR family n=1 Tax=Blastococcus saxobsidens (strain DD2) TaxID=1146883 RepID=H6RRX7_BLASD|nr:GntR family transcriptional regulator [Blastococcus saxobsidens]CCG02971.1 Transcriptional regulator, GntR family [Blastococcus saxobsidens DD2]